MNTLLTLKGIAKHFGGVHALRGVDFEVRAGEVHALVGENGAGKSTLMKVIAGVHKPDAGTLQLEGEPTRFRDPHDALDRGIALIHQETALAPDLTVAENVMLCQLPRLIGWRRLNERAAALIEGLGFHIDPRASVASLPTAHRQIVEIAKALSLNVKLLVLDEPTASLAPSDAERLLSIVRDLRARGVGIVYISHRLHEVFEIADRITVLKDGQTVSTVAPTSTTMDGLIRLMVGRPLAALFPKRAATPPGPPVLTVERPDPPGCGRRRLVRGPGRRGGRSRRPDRLGADRTRPAHFRRRPSPLAAACASTAARFVIAQHPRRRARRHRPGARRPQGRRGGAVDADPHQFDARAARRCRQRPSGLPCAAGTSARRSPPTDAVAAHQGA